MNHPTPTKKDAVQSTPSTPGMWEQPVGNFMRNADQLSEDEVVHQPSEGWESLDNDIGQVLSILDNLLGDTDVTHEEDGNSLQDVHRRVLGIRSLLATARREERGKVMKELGRYLEHTTHCDVYRADLSGYEGKVDCDCGLDKLLTQKKG